jgi:hypothetical protein
MVRRGVALVKFDGGGRERLFELADAVHRRGCAALTAVAAVEGGGLDLLVEVEPAGGAFVIDADQTSRGARLFEGLRDDNRDCLMIMIDRRAGEELGGVAGMFLAIPLIAAAKVVLNARTEPRPTAIPAEAVR